MIHLLIFLNLLILPLLFWRLLAIPILLIGTIIWKLRYVFLILLALGAWAYYRGQQMTPEQQARNDAEATQYRARIEQEAIARQRDPERQAAEQAIKDAKRQVQQDEKWLKQLHIPVTGQVSQ